MNLPGVTFKADHEWIKSEIAAHQPAVSKNRPLKRLMGILEKGSPTVDAERSWSLEFLKSPSRILPDESQSRVQAIEYEINRLEGPWDQCKAVGTGEHSIQECGIVLRSIGYKSVPMDGVPFDHQRGRVPNKYGKVQTADGQDVSFRLHCSRKVVGKLFLELIFSSLLFLARCLGCTSLDG